MFNLERMEPEALPPPMVVFTVFVETSIFWSISPLGRFTALRGSLWSNIYLGEDRLPDWRATSRVVTVDGVKVQYLASYPQMQEIFSDHIALATLFVVL